MFVGGVRWVQLLNNSDKNLTLDGFIIAVCAAGAGAGTISSLHPAPWSAEIREGVGVTSHQAPGHTAWWIPNCLDPSTLN